MKASNILFALGLLVAGLGVSHHAHAARLYTSGFELATTADGVEWSINQTPLAISTSTVRSGTYSARINAGNGFVRQHVFTANQNTIGYISAAVYIASAVNQNTQLLRWSTTGNVSVGNITLRTDNTLVLLASNGTQIGSVSSALSTNTWYCVQLKNDASAATGVLTASIDGTTFATGNNSNRGSFARVLVGTITGTQTTSDLYFDDIKINDNSGSSQTGFPGCGKVVITRPNGDGESTGWVIGGSSPAATRYGSVNETTPDDGVTLVATSTNNTSTLYTVSSLGLQSYDTIDVVQVGGRFNDATAADATSAFKFLIEKTNGGTKASSTAILPNSTTWRTNAPAAPDTYPLTAYTDPDGAAWTNSTLDTMRIGAITTAIGTRAIQLSTIWAYVDYTPGTAPSAAYRFFFMF